MKPGPVTLFQPKYGDFLYATISDGENESSLSLLSALARLGVDPWEEAAALSALSINAAATRLTSLLDRLPKQGRVSSITNVERLLQLLPHDVFSAAPTASARSLLSLAQSSLTFPVFAAAIVCVVIAFYLLTIRVDDQARPPHNEQSASQGRVE